MLSWEGNRSKWCPPLKPFWANHVRVSDTPIRYYKNDDLSWGRLIQMSPRGRLIQMSPIRRSVSRAKRDIWISLPKWKVVIFYIAMIKDELLKLLTPKQNFIHILNLRIMYLHIIKFLKMPLLNQEINSAWKLNF